MDDRVKSATTLHDLVGLGRHASIDTFVKGTSRRIDREVLVVLFEKRNVIGRQSLNLVNVLDGVVGTIAGNFARGMRIHAGEIFVFVLCVS